MDDLRKSPEELQAKVEHSRTWATHFENKDWAQWVLFMEELVGALAGLHDVDGARAEMTRIRDAAARLGTGDHADWLWTLAMGHYHLAQALHQRRDHDDAIAEYRDALHGWDRRATLHTADAQTAGLMAAALGRVGELLVEAGDLAAIAPTVVTWIEVHRRAGADASELAWRIRWARAWFEAKGAEGEAGAAAITQYLASVPLRGLPEPTAEENEATAVLVTMGVRLASGFGSGDLARRYGTIAKETEELVEITPNEPVFAHAVVRPDWRHPELAASVTLRISPDRELTVAALRATFGEYQGAPAETPFAPEIVTFAGGEANFHISADVAFVPGRKGSRRVERVVLSV